MSDLGIWVRSQDKKLLVIAEGFEQSDKFKDNDGHFVIAVHSSGSFKAATYMGAYATEERALQVLQLIGYHIYETERMKLFPLDGFVNPVFEMPEE